MTTRSLFGLMRFTASMSSAHMAPSACHNQLVSFPAAAREKEGRVRGAGAKKTASWVAGQRGWCRCVRESKFWGGTMCRLAVADKAHWMFVFRIGHRIVQILRYPSPNICSILGTKTVQKNVNPDRCYFVVQIGPPDRCWRKDPAAE